MKKVWPVLFAVAALAVAAALVQDLRGSAKPAPEGAPPGASIADRAKQEKPKADPAPARPGDYFPLTKGSAWTFAGEGNEYAAFAREVILAAGKRAVVIDANSGAANAAAYQVTDQAVTRTHHRPEVTGQPNLLEQPPNDQTVILTAPLKAGERWETPGGVREIAAIGAAVDTPAGAFKNCVRVRLKAQGSTIDEYYAPGVGLVKREFAAGDTKVTSTLQKYQVK